VIPVYECPNGCGSTTFDQITWQGETVYVNENGEPLVFEEVGEPEIKRVECGECGAVVEDNTRTFLVHPDGTGEIYNPQRVAEIALPEFFEQFTLPEDDSWQDVADRWRFYDATHHSEDEIAEILEAHNEDRQRILEHGDFLGFRPFIRNSLGLAGSDTGE
jgi:hypothetical protein